MTHAGDMDGIIFAVANGCVWDPDTTAAAASCELDDAATVMLLTAIHDRGCPWDSRTIPTGVMGGKFELAKYARNNGAPWGENAMDAMVQSKSVQMILWPLSTIVHGARSQLFPLSRPKINR